MLTPGPRTPLHELGEFRLIERLTHGIPLQHPSTVKGIGDDAAILAPQRERLVVTTDLLLEGVHFDLTYFPLKHLGYKAIAVNVSDVLAMNATPTQATVSIGISKKFCVEDLEALYQGVRLACNQFGVDLVGGDTSSSLTGLAISVTAIGQGEGAALACRSGARDTDLLCVTGDLGAAYLGLQLLEREKRVFLASGHMQPQLQGYSYVLERFLRPPLPLAALQQLRAQAIVPTAMIDISDGLSSELLHICRSSGVGCRVYPDRIPVAQETRRVAQELGIDPLTAALNGGEDYELLFTVPLAQHPQVQAMAGVSVIGHITPPESGAHLVTPDGQGLAITAQGWNALRAE